MDSGILISTLPILSPIREKKIRKLAWLFYFCVEIVSPAFRSTPFKAAGVWLATPDRCTLVFLSERSLFSF